MTEWLLFAVLGIFQHTLFQLSRHVEVPIILYYLKQFSEQGITH